jgi:hypothetical protein
MRRQAKVGTFKDHIEIVGIAAVVISLGFVAYEIRQNNELAAAEARQVRTSMVVDAWRFTAENSEFAEIRVRDNNGEEISDAERIRIDSHVMSIYVMLDWTFQELSEDSPEMKQVREVQRHNFATHSGYRRVWEARKNSFRPEFVQWMEENVVNQQ